MNISEGDLRAHADKRITALGAQRREWEPGAEEVARFTLRWLSPYIRNMGSNRNVRQQTVDGHTYSGGQANNRLFNSTASRAHRTLSAGMSSGMSSPSQPWFKLKFADSERGAAHAVKVWTDDVQTLLYAFLAQTNVYQAMQSSYRELGIFGVSSILWVPHWQYGAVAYAQTFGEYWLGQDDGLRVDTMIRDTTMSAGQMAERFAEDKLSRTVKNLLADKKFDAQVEVRHIIEPNRDRAFGKLDKTNMAYRSYYIEQGSDEKKVLEVGGFKRKPMSTPRWESMGTSAYSVGPGFDALPESRKVQLQEIRYQQAQDYTVRPSLEMAVANRNSGANLIPGGITWSASQDLAGQGAKPIWQINASALPALSQDISQRTEPAILDAFYANLFMAITNMRGVQPRNVEEIARRNEEQLAQLGPVVDRVQVEKLAVIVLQAFEMLSDAGKLPPVPEEINGAELSIEFISVLAQAQRMIGLGSMERAVGFVGNIAGVYPAILDVPDFEGIVADYTSRLGIPAKSMRSEKDVAAIREQRAAEQQQAAQAEQMAAMAPAMQQVAAGAELLSKTDANAGLLPRLLPPAMV